MFGGRTLFTKIFGGPFLLARELIRPPISRYRQARSGHLLAVNVNSWVGLFAHLEWFLEISLHCERHGLTPCFMSSSPQYVDPERGSDWYRYFFTNPQLAPEDRDRIERREVPVCRIDGIRQLGLPENYDPQLTLEIGCALVAKYIGIRREMRDKVDVFVGRHMRDRRALGIHYRGTDKNAEAPPVPYALYKRTVNEFLKSNTEFDCLFVSSDEQEFVDRIAQDFGRSLPVVYHDDLERSRAGVAIHRSKNGDRYAKTEEAILNCLLLSRCDALIKNASFLSAWSKLFNPALRVILLNSPFVGQLWFPDRELVSRTSAK